MKKINFYSNQVSLDIQHPQPASKFLPIWFKKIAVSINGIETIKKCMPFLDSMRTGYMIVLTADVKFDGEHFEEVSKVRLVTSHYKEQIDGFVVPAEYTDKPWKWTNFFTMKTPRGYSTLFTHPLNRPELPFYSLSGVVDTDTFPAPVNFPFFVKKDFRGIIPAGTPIAQAIPFKRTAWKHEVEDTKPYQIPIDFLSSANPPFGFYKKNFWSKKIYQ